MGPELGVPAEERYLGEVEVEVEDIFQLVASVAGAADEYEDGVVAQEFVSLGAREAASAGGRDSYQVTGGGVHDVDADIWGWRWEVEKNDRRCM